MYRRDVELRYTGFLRSLSCAFAAIAANFFCVAMEIFLGFLINSVMRVVQRRQVQKGS